MADPVTTLPADLPEDWTEGQIVAPEGASVGLTQQHGYNYLNKAVNDAQKGINEIRESLSQIPPVLPISKGGTGLTNLYGDDYAVSRVRGVSILQHVPVELANGEVCCVVTSIL